MRSLFSGSKNQQEELKLQYRLMILAVLFLLCYAIILTLAPSIRSHSPGSNLQWGHWTAYGIWLLGFGILFHQLNHLIPDHDPYLLPLVAVLSGWGLLTIWRLEPDLGTKQMIWFSVSLLLVTLALRLQNLPILLQRYKYLWLTLGLFLTALTLFFGVNPTGYGPRLWLVLQNIYIQPSEPLKLLLVIYLAAYFTDHLQLPDRFLLTILPTLVMALLTFLLLIMQRDLGTASIFMFLYTIMLIITTQRRRLLWLTPLIFILSGVTGYYLFDIVKARIDTWLNPWLNTGSTAYQIVQARIAIASGGLVGTGPGLGSPGLIPVAVSDFIFSAIAEESGLLGTTALILIFMLLIMRAVTIAMHSRATFQRYLSFGIAAYFAVQSFLIIGGNLGLLPLTGVTLPFMSYGGSSLMTNFACLLLLLVISGQEKGNYLSTKVLRPYTNLSRAFCFILLLTILTNSYLSIWQRADLVNRPENPRWIIYDRYVPRSDLLDINGLPIVINTGTSGTYQRQIQHIPLSPVIGYTSAFYGQSGLEQSLYPYLRGLEGLPFQTVWWHQILYNQPPPGLDFKLSLNLPLQQTTDMLMDGVSGAVVLMNAETGEIYVMASHPYFNANSLEEDWSTLIDDPAAPLLNRATQGLYPLGNAGISLLLPAYLQSSGRNLNTVNVSNRMDIDCYLASNRSISPFTSLQFACNQAFADLVSQIPQDDLFETMDRLGLYTMPTLQVPIPQPAQKPASKVDIASYLSGEEGFLISPLHMALVSAAYTNQGKMPAPRLVNSYQNAEGQWLTFPNQAEPFQALPVNHASQIINLLQSTSEPFWFITGTARNAAGEKVIWYLGGSLPGWQSSPLAVAIVMEANNSLLAQSIGQTLLTRTSGN